MVNSALTSMMLSYRDTIEKQLYADKINMKQRKLELTKQVEDNQRKGKIYKIPEMPFHYECPGEEFFPCRMSKETLPGFENKRYRPSPMVARRLMPGSKNEKDIDAENEKAYNKARELYEKVEVKYSYPCQTEQVRRTIKEHRINFFRSVEMKDPICNCTLIKRGEYLNLEKSGYVSDFEYSAFYGSFNDELNNMKTTRKKRKRSLK